jgi:hypothetical protein
MCNNRVTTTTTRIRPSRSPTRSKRRIGITSLMIARNSSRFGLSLKSLLASHIIPDWWCLGSRLRSRCWGLLRLPSARGTQKIRRRGGIATSFPAFPASYLLTKKKEALTWGAQGWAKDAQAKTEEFRKHGPRAAASWTLVEGRDKIPNSALVVGKDKDNNEIFAARVFFEHSLRTSYRSCFFHPLIHCPHV